MGFKGQHLTEETKARMREAQRLRFADPAARAVMSQAKRGRKMSPEGRAALRLARQKQWSLARVDMRITRLGCWEPQNVGNVRHLLRRLWERENGPLPSGRQLNHRCDNGECARPAHVYAGTVSQNSQDAWAVRRRRPDLRAVPVPDDWDELERSA